MASAKAFLAATALLLVVACDSFKAKAPEGFAVYEGNRPFRAMSADGVVYRVRTVNDSTDATLAFWQEALKKRMLDAGYVFLREGEAKSSGQTGYVLEVTAPYGVRDYTYLMAVFKRDKHLVLVESSGEVATFEKRRPQVLEAIEGLAIN
ncbi:MAG: hypothetical protein ACAI38_04260 [Myxococcota bacterium]